MEGNNFFATISRMKYIERWALMRNNCQENICEHSMDVSVIAHALAVIGNKYFNKDYNSDKTALFGMYHDASEIITGDMPTPVKYYNNSIKKAFKDIEKEANNRLLDQLPYELKEEYSHIFFQEEQYIKEWKLVKAADKISAYIKCIEEENTGNKEFITAKETLRDKIKIMEADFEEVKYFMDNFIDAFGKTLDQLT